MALLNRFVALQDLPGGIVKGDEISLSFGKAILVKNSKSVPYEVEKETKFFKKVKETKFKEGDSVTVLENISATIVPGKKMTGLHTFTSYSPKQININRLTELKVIKAEVETKAKGKKTVDIEILTVRHPGGYTVKIDTSVHKISHLKKYFFVNSKGTITSEIVGRDAAADEYRKSVCNFYNYSDEAKIYKDELINTFKSSIKSMKKLKTRPEKGQAVYGYVDSTSPQYVMEIIDEEIVRVNDQKDGLGFGRERLWKDLYEVRKVT